MLPPRIRPSSSGIFIFALLVLLGCALSGAVKATSAAEKSPGVTETPPPGEIKFKCKNLFSTTTGTFKNWRFTKVEIDRQDAAKSVVQLEVDIDTIQTGNSLQTKHLKSDEFFDAPKFPKANLKIYGAHLKEKNSAGQGVYTAKLDFDLHGKKKTFDLQFEVATETPLEIEGSLTLLRSDFGIGAPHSRINPTSPEDEVFVNFKATLPEKSP